MNNNVEVVRPRIQVPRLDLLLLLIRIQFTSSKWIEPECEWMEGISECIGLHRKFELDNGDLRLSLQLSLSLFVES